MRALTIRLPDDVAEKLQAIAEFEYRSLNEQIVYGLKLFIDAYERHPRLSIRLERIPPEDEQ